MKVLSRGGMNTPQHSPQDNTFLMVRNKRVNLVDPFISALLFGICSCAKAHRQICKKRAPTIRLVGAGVRSRGTLDRCDQSVRRTSLSASHLAPRIPPVVVFGPARVLIGTSLFSGLGVDRYPSTLCRGGTKGCARPSWMLEREKTFHTSLLSLKCCY